MDNRPIGIFDSGLGGLTTVREFQRILPSENIIYFGDTSRVPYGTRSTETIKKYVKQDINFLFSHDVKMVIAACNTACTVITPDDIKKIPVQFLDVILPAVNVALKQTKNKRIGVIGTNATIKSDAYKKAIEALEPSAEVFSNACPLFVPLVENGFYEEDNQITILTAEKYLKPLIDANVDTLILGCTHYPIIKHIIKKIMGDSVYLVDSGQSVVSDCKAVLEKTNMLNQTKKIGEVSYFVSDSTKDFKLNAQLILGQDVLGTVNQIDIEKY